MSLNAPAPVLITGASGGIGADLARLFARDGHPLALVARNGEALAALAAELGATGGMPPRVIALDLARVDAAQDLSKQLAELAFRPAILVNNAGYGLNGHVASLPRAAQMDMLDLNIRTLSDLTLTFLPDIIAAKGGILNVASVAGFMPGPGMAAYYASKAFVLSFSQAIATELRPSGVTVSVLCPGPTDTGFFTRAGGRVSALKKFGMMASLPVAEAGYRGFRAGQRVIVPGLGNKIMTAVVPFVPRSLLLRIVARAQALPAGTSRA